ncbi:MAG TPA: ATP-binding protein [Blastocatellia bacterium]|nr:ATP-binding protein [Blastocatellia bacterium]
MPGDPDRIQQIVQNLLANSIKFTPEAGRIDVRLAQKQERAEIIVSETGLGIASEFRKPSGIRCLFSFESVGPGEISDSA